MHGTGSRRERKPHKGSQWQAGELLYSLPCIDLLKVASFATMRTEYP